MDIQVILTNVKETMKQWFALKSEVPTKTSDLVNDSNFLTEHQNLSQYVKKSELATQIDNTIIERYDTTLSTSNQALRGHYSSFYLFYDLYYGVKIDLEIQYGGDSMYYQQMYGNFGNILTYDGEHGIDINSLTIKKPSNVNVEIYSMDDRYGITITHTGTVPSSGTAKIMIYGLTPMYYDY